MWRYFSFFVVAGCLVVDLVVCGDPKITDVARAREWLNAYSKKVGEIWNEAALAEWNYKTDIRNETQRKMVSDY